MSSIATKLLKAVTAILIPAIMFCLGCSRNGHTEKGTVVQMKTLADQGNWNELRRYARENMKGYLAMNYYHLAGAHLGIMAEQLFSIPQHGPLGLIDNSHDKSSEPCNAYILYACGNIAGAQNVAFNALQRKDGYDTAMLKMLAEIEIMRGSYAVADKYLHRLERYRQHKEWASDERRFLWNDALVEADPVLGRGRRDFPTEDGFVNEESPFIELQRIIRANPSDTLAMEYALSYLLLAKDINSVAAFVEEHFGEPALTSLPTPAQEALVFFSEYYSHMDEPYLMHQGLSAEQIRRYKSFDREWCISHGLTQKVIDRFAEFQTADSKSHDGRGLHGFHGTFWYYLLYTKI